MSANWNFLTNHGHILFLLAIEPELTVREISLKVGITERAALRIISDLEQDNYIEISKQGRKNTYNVRTDKSLKHDLEKQCQIKDFVNVIKKQS